MRRQIIFKRREEDITPLLIDNDIFIRSLSDYTDFLILLEGLHSIFSKEYKCKSFVDIFNILYSGEIMYHDLSSNTGNKNESSFDSMFDGIDKTFEKQGKIFKGKKKCFQT